MNVLTRSELAGLRDRCPECPSPLPVVPVDWTVAGGEVACWYRCLNLRCGHQWPVSWALSTLDLWAAA